MKSYSLDAKFIYLAPSIDCAMPLKWHSASKEMNISNANFTNGILSEA